jgi:glycosyltransferase involved in cell wall biosynthesis
VRRIFYVVPDLRRKLPFSFRSFIKHTINGGVIKYLKSCLFREKKPIGGVKVIYQHCMLLRDLGFDAKVVLMGNYHGNYFDFETPTVKYEEVINTITTKDIVVATEFKPYQGLLFKETTKILFLQNWMGLTMWLMPDDRKRSYIELGYHKVITCSKFCSEYVQEHMNIPAYTITNGIDLGLFQPDEKKRIPMRVLAMSRKNPKDLETIRSLLKYSDYDIRVVDGLKQNELIEEYQSSDVFIATGYPEGFSLPPLEAMACGCVVVGFTGGAGREFMLHNETALVAEDGDCKTVVEMLLGLLDNPQQKEKIRIQGLAKAKEYGLENTKLELQSFYNELFNSSKISKAP